MELNNHRKLFVVLGMHRSGTSVIARALKVFDIPLGDNLISPVEDDNPKGFWEDKDINALNIEMMSAIDIDWHSLAPIQPSELDALRKKGYFARAETLINAKVENLTSFGIKDPRISKLLPLWKEVFDHSQFDQYYILALRNPISVAKSLDKRDGFPPRRSYYLWLDHVITSLLYTQGEKRIVLDYDRLLQHPEKELGRVSKYFGLHINSGELKEYVTDFLDSELCHTKFNKKEVLIDDKIPPLAGEIYSLMLDGAVDKFDINNTGFESRLKSWLDERERIKPALILADELNQSEAEQNAQVVRKQFAKIGEILQVVAEPDSNILKAQLSGSWYLQQNPDIAEAGIDPYEHWLGSGMDEGRLPASNLVVLARKLVSEREQSLRVAIEEKERELRQMLHESLERQKDFTERVIELQQTVNQERVAQRFAIEEKERELRQAQHESLERQKDFTERLIQFQETVSQERASLKKQYSRHLFDLNHKLGAIQSTWTWRLTAPLRMLFELIGIKPDYSLIDPNQISSIFASEDQKSVTFNPETNTFNDHASTSVDNDKKGSSTNKSSLITISSARSLNELLAHDNGAFVTCAYLSLLGRAPDPEGFAYYMERLKKSGKKLAIIYQIYLGQEAKPYINNIAGLESAMKHQKWKQMPILGAVLGVFDRDSKSDQIFAVQRPDNSQPGILDADITTRSSRMGNTNISKIAVFTIASKNYLAYVRVLLTSVAELHPEYDLYLCLVDRVDGYFDSANEPFTVIQADQIGIPTFEDMALRYDIMEFNTAVKPFMFQWLFKNTDLDAVIYLDPDIRAYSRFERLEGILEAGASVVLTPHITQPLEDGKIPDDYNMLQSGVFNLGFIAARRCKESSEFLGWWSRRLATQAVADFKINLFTDQRWCDLAPCFLDELHVLKDSGYNVAYWNLAQRQIIKNEIGVWQANGSPLVFFHFSGVSADKNNIVSKHQNRFQWDDIPKCRPLFDEYSNTLFKAGWGETKSWPYAYSQVPGGFVVTPIVRLLYRKTYPDSLFIEPADVAAVLIRLCNEPAESMPSDERSTVTRLMYFIYTLRDDLRAAFNLGTPEGRCQFVSWFAEAGPREYGLPTSVTRQLSLTNSQAPRKIGNQQPVAAVSASGVSAEPLTRVQDAGKDEQGLNSSENNEREIFALNASNAYTSTIRSIDELLSFDDETFVTCAYLTLLGHLPDPQGRMYYVGRLKNGIEKLEIICQIYRSPESRQRNDNISGLKIAILHRTWTLFPKVMQKPVKNIWAKLIAYSLQTKASPIPNSTSSIPRNEQEGPSSKIDLLDQPAEVPTLLGDQFISNLMYLIWRSRPDLQQTFDLMTAVGQKDFAAWYQASAHLEYGLIPDVPKLTEVKSTRNSNGQWARQGATGANLIGYAHAELGMGEHVRMTAAALKNTNTIFKVVNFNVGVSSRQKATLDHGELSDGNPYKTNIFHINADQMLLAYCHLGRGFFSHRYNIGYWAWELSNCPEDWVPVLGMMDEVWAPSKFIQEAFSQRTDMPVEYMPLCVTLPPLKGYTRKHFGLPQKAFVFLYTFDFFSYLDRKNPFAAIRAFKLAFPDNNHRVVLVLKIMNGDQKSPLWSNMMNLIDGDQRIIVMNKVMDRDEVIGLFDVCDCFVSLHRSEGFGRGPAEAMYLGKPVIVTNYSGNTDFTLPDNSCLVDYKLIPVEAGQYPFHQNQVWADPDVEHASWYMRKVYEDHAFSKAIGIKGQEFIHQNFNQNAIGKLYADRLHKLGLA